MAGETGLIPNAVDYGSKLVIAYAYPVVNVFLGTGSVYGWRSHGMKHGSGTVKGSERRRGGHAGEERV